MIAFIFSSAQDSAIARLCAAHLAQFGVRSCVVFDEADSHCAEANDLLSSFPRRGRLFGVECASGMADIMFHHSIGHAVVAKVDADTLLRSSGVEWLSGAVNKARGFRLDGVSKWSGIWACPRSVLKPAKGRFLQATNCTGCPEAHLFWSYFKRFCGIERAPEGAICVCNPESRAPNPEALAVTLPSRLNSKERAVAASALFSNNR